MSLYCQPATVRAAFPSSTQNVDDGQLMMAVSLASSDVENYCRRVLSLNTYTETQSLVVDNQRRIVVPLDQYPIVSVLSLSLTLVGSSVPLTLSPALADTATPPERFLYYPLHTVPIPPWWSINQQSAGLVLTTYSAGFSPIPSAVVTATVLLTLSYLGRDANPLGATIIAVGIGDPTRFEVDDTDRNARKAYQLLDVYVRRYA